MRSRPLAMLCLLAVILLPSGAWAAEGGFRCEELTFDVNLSPSDPAVYSVFGVLCSRGSIERRQCAAAVPLRAVGARAAHHAHPQG